MREPETEWYYTEIGMTDKEIMEYDLKYWIMPERVFIQNMNITNYDEA